MEAITQCSVPYARSLMGSSVTWWWAVRLHKDCNREIAKMKFVGV